MFFRSRRERTRDGKTIAVDQPPPAAMALAAMPTTVAPAPDAECAKAEGRSASGARRSAVDKADALTKPANPAVASSITPALTTLPPEVMQQRVEQSHKLLQAFGAIVAIYLRSKSHREMRLCDIENVVGPAITTGQFSIAETANKSSGQVMPAAAVLWASVSAAVDSRLTSAPDAPIALSPADWKSGDVIWIVEAIGEQQMVSAVIKRLHGTVWKERIVKLRTVSANGRRETRVLGEKVSF